MAGEEVANFLQSVNNIKGSIADRKMAQKNYELSTNKEVVESWEGREAMELTLGIQDNKR